MPVSYLAFERNVYSNAKNFSTDCLIMKLGRLKHSKRLLVDNANGGITLLHRTWDFESYLYFLSFKMVFFKLFVVLGKNAIKLFWWGIGLRLTTPQAFIWLIILFTRGWNCFQYIQNTLRGFEVSSIGGFDLIHIRPTLFSCLLGRAFKA